MPHQTLPLQAEGPLIEVLVGVTPSQAHTLRSAGQAVPAPLRLRGVLDTAASQTCIDLQCVSALALVPAGQASMLTPAPTSALQTYDLYDVDLTLLHPRLNWARASLAVVAADLLPQGFEVLVGRDVLKDCLLIYDGPADTFTLGF
jgi:hypothetical protein